MHNRISNDNNNSITNGEHCLSLKSTIVVAFHFFNVLHRWLNSLSTFTTSNEYIWSCLLYQGGIWESPNNVINHLEHYSMSSEKVRHKRSFCFHYMTLFKPKYLSIYTLTLV